MEKYKIETQLIQGGYSPKDGEPRVLPITQSTTYKYSKCQEVADLFDLESSGHMYSRISNPTVEAFEEKMALLEGGVGALAVSSGQAAVTVAITNILKQGDHLISSQTLYGGTYSLMKNTLSRFGIEVTFVNPELSIEELVKYIKPTTKAIYAETIGNPGMNVIDFEKFSELAHTANVPFIIDNTFATPFLCKPIEFGADIVLHSTTKYIDGQATSLGGVIIDSGNYDFGNGKFREFVEPDPSYHGMVYSDKFGKTAYIVKARTQMLRDLGMVMSPFNAFMMHHGLETLHLRMERHSANALAIAKYLEKHDKVKWVNYPMLESHSSKALSDKYLPKGASGVLSFGILGGKVAGEKFIESLQLIALVVHVADVRTCILHPSSTTHRQLSETEQIQAGVSPDLIRLSVGIENVADLIEDLEQGFSKI